MVRLLEVIEGTAKGGNGRDQTQLVAVPSFSDHYSVPQADGDSGPGPAQSLAVRLYVALQDTYPDFTIPEDSHYCPIHFTELPDFKDAESCIPCQFGFAPARGAK